MVFAFPVQETELLNALQVEPKPEIRSFIRDWMPGSKIEEYVVSATIEAIKPRA